MDSLLQDLPKYKSAYEKVKEQVKQLNCIVALERQQIFEETADKEFELHAREQDIIAKEEKLKQRENDLDIAGVVIDSSDKDLADTVLKLQEENSRLRD